MRRPEDISSTISASRSGAVPSAGRFFGQVVTSFQSNVRVSGPAAVSAAVFEPVSAAGAHAARTSPASPPTQARRAPRHCHECVQSSTSRFAYPNISHFAPTLRLEVHLYSGALAVALALHHDALPELDVEYALSDA